MKIFVKSHVYGKDFCEVGKNCNEKTSIFFTFIEREDLVHSDDCIVPFSKNLLCKRKKSKLYLRVKNFSIYLVMIVYIYMYIFFFFKKYYYTKMNKVNFL